MIILIIIKIRFKLMTCNSILLFPKYVFNDSPSLVKNDNDCSRDLYKTYYKLNYLVN